MLTKLTHTSLIVADQEAALRFFVEKLGFEKRDDTMMGPGQRWLTIGVKGQPKVEIILQAVDWGLDRSTPEERNGRIGKQSLCFSSSDIAADYQAFQKRGVKTLGKIEKMPWGHQFSFEDCCANVHLVVQ